MKKIIDHFSKQSNHYKKYRPSYPSEIYQTILSCVEQKNVCWDCGTGNGQVAFHLSQYFKKVYATDISPNQIEQALLKENIRYQVSRSEKTTLADHTINLITVAQAIHWFDLAKFYTEVKRVGVKGGIIAVWGYGLIRINSSLDKLIDTFYHEVVGPYWDPERKHVEQHYRNISFEFEEIKILQTFYIKSYWSLDHLEGYLSTWSSVKKYIRKKGNNPLLRLLPTIKSNWHEKEIKPIEFPIFLRLGRIND